MISACALAHPLRRVRAELKAPAARAACGFSAIFLAAHRAHAPAHAVALSMPSPDAAEAAFEVCSVAAAVALRTAAHTFALTLFVHTCLRQPPSMRCGPPQPQPQTHSTARQLDIGCIDHCCAPAAPKGCAGVRNRKPPAQPPAQVRMSLAEWAAQRTDPL